MFIGDIMVQDDPAISMTMDPADKTFLSSVYMRTRRPLHQILQVTFFFVTIPYPLRNLPPVGPKTIQQISIKQRP